MVVGLFTVVAIKGLCNLWAIPCDLTSFYAPCAPFICVPCSSARCV